MPSVTVTTEPTLRASVAAVKFWMRDLISSLISDALMAMHEVPNEEPDSSDPRGAAATSFRLVKE